MLSKSFFKKSVTIMTAAAFWCVTSMVALAAPADVTGDVAVTGTVTVNGQPATTNTTVVSGSVIATADNSSAVVSLGKAGRVELGANSSLTLKFAANEITAVNVTGKARVSNNAGVATTVTTKDATIMADAGQANSFAVEVECSHTHVDTVSGLVTMRTGTSDKQVAAGTDAVAGNLSQTGCQPCLRPGPAAPVASIGALPLAALLVAIGAGIGTAIVLGGDKEVEPTCCVTVTSPVR